MKVYYGGRASGKTTRLIKESAITGSIIVCASTTMANCIMTEAKKMGLTIPNPITPPEFAFQIAGGQYHPTKRSYLIDELQTVLQSMNVASATINVTNLEDIDCVM